VRWRHDRTGVVPLGVGGGVVVEAVGGPFDGRLAGDSPADPGRTGIRAVDAETGELRWSTEVTLHAGPHPNMFTPTVGDAVLAVPQGPTSTVLLSLSTGDPIRTAPGLLVADDGALVVTNPLDGQQAGVTTEDGDELGWIDGARFVGLVDGSGTSPGALVLLGGSRLALVDDLSGAPTWEVDVGTTLAFDTGGIATLTARRLELLDPSTGSVRWQFEIPTAFAQVAGAAVGDELVVVAIPAR
jgi:outer membrane protein assembly factor BamB